MEINVVGRHMDVPDRFRRHLEDKLDKITQLAPEALRVDVEISHENNPRQAELCDRVELTVHDRRAVVRSEARADDLYGALDVAYGRLLERLRRARDRAKDRRRGKDRAHGEPESVRGMQAEGLLQSEDGTATSGEPTTETGESPVVIREKRHAAVPMSIDDALYRMELVGHDFYLFIDEGSGHPKVVYRRKGWNYGVIELDPDAEPEVESETAPEG